MRRSVLCRTAAMAVAVLRVFLSAWAQEPRPSSYSPVVEEDFDKVVAQMQAARPDVQKKHAALLDERYDLGDKPAKGMYITLGQIATVYYFAHFLILLP